MFVPNGEEGASRRSQFLRLLLLLRVLRCLSLPAVPLRRDLLDERLHHVRLPSHQSIGNRAEDVLPAPFGLFVRGGGFSDQFVDPVSGSDTETSTSLYNKGHKILDSRVLLQFRGCHKACSYPWYPLRASGADHGTCCRTNDAYVDEVDGPIQPHLDVRPPLRTARCPHVGLRECSHAWQLGQLLLQSVPHRVMAPDDRALPLPAAQGVVWFVL